MEVSLVRTKKGKLLYSGMKVSSYMYDSVKQISCCTHNCTREIYCFYDYDTGIITFRHKGHIYPCPYVPMHHGEMRTAIRILVQNIKMFRMVSQRCHECKRAVKATVLFTSPKVILTRSNICFYQDNVDYFMAISVTKTPSHRLIPTFLKNSKKRQLHITLPELIQKLAKSAKKVVEFEIPGSVSYIASCVRHSDPVFYPVCFTKNKCYQCGVDFNTEVFTKSNAKTFSRITKDHINNKRKRTVKNQLYSSACVWSKDDTLYISTSVLPEISDVEHVFGDIAEKNILFNVRDKIYPPNRMMCITPCTEKLCKECKQREIDQTPVCCACLKPETEIEINPDTQMCQKCIDEIDPKYAVTELNRAISKHGMLKSDDDYTNCSVCKTTC
jgi:hypothetical protein